MSFGRSSAASDYSSGRVQLGERATQRSISRWVTLSSRRKKSSRAAIRSADRRPIRPAPRAPLRARPQIDNSDPPSRRPITAQLRRRDGASDAMCVAFLCTISVLCDGGLMWAVRRSVSRAASSVRLTHAWRATAACRCNCWSGAGASARVEASRLGSNFDDVVPR